MDNANLTKAFDVTTPEGIKQKEMFVKNLSGSDTGLSSWMARLSVAVTEYLVRGVNSGVTTKKQAEAAEELIRAGNENNVKRMKITMDNEAGVHLNLPIEGCNIEFKVSTEGKTLVDVEYK